MTMARDGGREAFVVSALERLPDDARDDFGGDRRDICSLRSDLAALRFIAVEFPKRESQSEDSAWLGPQQRLPSAARIARHTRRK
jgi:hypothetical protein